MWRLLWHVRSRGRLNQGLHFQLTSLCWGLQWNWHSKPLTSFIHLRKGNTAVVREKCSRCIDSRMYWQYDLLTPVYPHILWCFSVCLWSTVCLTLFLSSSHFLIQHCSPLTRYTLFSWFMGKREGYMHSVKEGDLERHSIRRRCTLVGYQLHLCVAN